MDPHGHPQEIKEWTSEQLNLIFTKVKVKVNIHSLLNILKSYYVSEWESPKQEVQTTDSPDLGNMKTEESSS